MLAYERYVSFEFCALHFSVGRLVALLPHLFLMALKQSLFELSHILLIEVVEEVHQVSPLAVWTA